MSNPSLSEDLRRILLHSTRVSSFFLGRDDNYHERLAPGYVLSTMEIHTPNSSWENPWKIHGTSAWWFQTCVFSTALWDDILTWFNPPPQVKKSEKWLLLVHKPLINPYYPAVSHYIISNIPRKSHIIPTSLFSLTNHGLDMGNHPQVALIQLSELLQFTQTNLPFSQHRSPTLPSSPGAENRPIPSFATSETVPGLHTMILFVYIRCHCTMYVSRILYRLCSV